jgi:hypothetical protein
MGPGGTGRLPALSVGDTNGHKCFTASLVEAIVVR